jgi:hypothetical protein
MRAGGVDRRGQLANVENRFLLPGSVKFGQRRRELVAGSFQETGFRYGPQDSGSADLARIEGAWTRAASATGVQRVIKITGRLG